MLRFEEVFTHKRLLEASKRVKKKNASAGRDKMTAKEAYAFFKKKYKRDIIIKRLKRGDYIAHKSRVAKIPKDNGKKRTIKINSVIDRVVLDCLADGLQKKFGSMFSEHSYGYKKGVGTHTALFKLKEYYDLGFAYGLKLDLKAYFDKVPHKELYEDLDGMVDDGIMRVINTFIISSDNTGLPMGFPISPFLSSLYLTPFDKWLETFEDLRFIRYCDDILILSRKSIENSLIDDIEVELGKLKIILNKEKTRLGRIEGMTFLGLTVSEKGFVVSDERTLKFKTKVNAIYSEFEGQDCLVEKLRQYVMGWVAYYHLADLGVLIKETEGVLLTHLNEVNELGYIEQLERLQENLPYKYN